ISAELTDCCNGFTLWSETFEREMQGIFALQDEITRAIVDALKLKLDISAPLASRLVRSTAAYDVYLHGLFYSDRTSEEDLRTSLIRSRPPRTISRPRFGPRAANVMKR